MCEGAMSAKSQKLLVLYCFQLSVFSNYPCFPIIHVFQLSMFSNYPCFHGNCAYSRVNLKASFSFKEIVTVSCVVLGSLLVSILLMRCPGYRHLSHIQFTETVLTYHQLALVSVPGSKSSRSFFVCTDLILGSLGI